MSLWERRRLRAEALEARLPDAAPALRFYRAVLAWQATADPASPAEAKLPALLDLVRREGPAGMARWTAPGEVVAARAQGDPLARWLVLLAAQPGCRAPSGTRSGADVPARCPACAEPPLAALLRDDREAEAVRRTLVCPLCAGEWAFPRVICPSCGEERPEKLPRFSAAERPWVRVDACDACGVYVKALDLVREPEADPMVDDLATVALDLVARDRGYVRLSPGLSGL